MSKESKLLDAVGRALVIAAVSESDPATVPETEWVLRNLLDAVGHALMQQAKKLDAPEVNLQ